MLLGFNMHSYLISSFYPVRSLLLLFTVMSLSACSSLSGHIKDGNMPAARNMIAEGADVNGSNQSGAPLWWAAYRGNMEAIKLLVGAGADINLSTALGGAVWGNHFEAAKYLLEAGADVNGESNMEETPMQFAAAYSPDLIGILLEYGAEVNSQNWWGSTPLFYIARFQLKGKGLKALLEAGADPGIARDNGDTPLMWAMEYDNHVVAGLLNTYQSDQSDWQIAKNTDTEQAYKGYLQKHNISGYRKEVNSKIAEIQAARGALKIAKKAKKQKQQASKLVNLKKHSRCKLHEKNWVYTSGNCSGKYGHGMGKAVTVAGLSFEGRFKNGYRTSGKILLNNALMYDGPIQNGKPHGTGICMNKGEPEDCNYYHGKRTDVLFKQRIEFAEQKKIMLDQQKNLDEKLARLGGGSGGKGKTAMDLVTNAAKKKAADEAVDYLFDQLF